MERCVSNSLVCPKPRRISDHFICGQKEVSDSRATAELFGLIFSMGDKSNSQVLASSPSFFIGSPPSRVSNPLIEDSRFGYDRVSPISAAVALAVSPSSSGCRGWSFSRAKYGNKPVAVGIEGFNCLSVA